MDIPISTVITLYVLLLGPLKLIEPFAVATANADRALRWRIGNRAFVVSTIVAILMATIGEVVVSRFSLSLGVLAITTGLFLGHWAVGKALAKPGSGTATPDEATIGLALFPISMPGIVPPQAIALLVLSSHLVIETHVVSSLLTVVMLILAVMALNWLFMLSIPSLMRFPGATFWRVVSRTAGVIIAAMALQIVMFGLRDLGIVP